jgi:hypothetical protein
MKSLSGAWSTVVAVAASRVPGRSDSGRRGAVVPAPDHPGGDRFAARLRVARQARAFGHRAASSGRRVAVDVLVELARRGSSVAAEVALPVASGIAPALAPRVAADVGEQMVRIGDAEIESVDGST